MTDKPTPEQIQIACVLANARADRATADADCLRVMVASMQAERDKARADLGEIYIQLDGVSGLHRLADDSRQAIEAAHDTAAPYRVEADPLVDWVFDAMEVAFSSKDLSSDTPELRREFAKITAAELAKRGLEIGRSA